MGVRGRSARGGGAGLRASERYLGFQHALGGRAKKIRQLAAFLASPRRAQFGCELAGPDGVPCKDSPSARRARNCRGEHEPVRLEFCGCVFDECPIGILEREPWILDAWEEFVLFKAFGVLPKSGGLDDQTAWVIEAMLVFEEEITRIGQRTVETEDGKRFRGKRR